MKRQTAKQRAARRSISIPVATFDKMAAFAREHNLPMSSVMRELIEHAVNGAVAVSHGPPKDGAPVADADAVAKRETFIAIIRAQQAARKPPPPTQKIRRTFPPGAFCGICARSCGGEPYYAEPVGRNDGLVNVCAQCRTGAR